ncbi:hypothetical protein HPP92_025969 [Vanilla planifolia]|uniref:Pentatricopeptide repeat-containing protein n=1 Tax=Vanilla planifolia TaxID=51239 RepID=A0A835PGB8_VANPL|nr:hypothetical protein HPP92_025969 [Vanilla planifolia]
MERYMKGSNVKENVEKLPYQRSVPNVLPEAILEVKVEKLTCRKLVRCLVSCNRAKRISIGKQVHGFALKSGLLSHGFLASSLIDVYSKCGFVRDSRAVFDAVKWKDLVLWNVLVSCYAFNGPAREAYKVFELMRLQGVAGDGFTLSALLSTCVSFDSLESGRQTHGVVIKMGFVLDIVVGGSLLNMYAKCGAIADARLLFDGMPQRNVVVWNAIIVGYGRCGQFEEAVKALAEMIREGWQPDELTLSSVLSSCASLAAGIDSEQVHCFAVKTNLCSFPSTANALIVSYAKIGSIYNSYKCFSSISAPNLITWTSMIHSFAFHGFAAEAVALFERMLQEGENPDSVIFVALLSACSHAGLLEIGLQYFESMKKEHQIEPRAVHYACIVDLLGRAGHVHVAYRFIAQMPFEPNSDVLGAFLSACKFHGNVEMAQWAADKLLVMEPNDSVNYRSMSNIHATCKHWKRVADVRRTMRQNCRLKVPGCSWLEIDGKVRSFVSNDESHPQANEIYFVLEMLIGMMEGE